MGSAIGLIGTVGENLLHRIRIRLVQTRIWQMLRGIVLLNVSDELVDVVRHRDYGVAANSQRQQLIKDGTELGREVLNIGIEVAVILGDNAEHVRPTPS